MGAAERRTVVVWLAVAFALRLGYAFYERVQPYSDGAHYDRLGWHLSTGAGYVDEHAGPGPDGNAVVWPPGYPWLLSLVYRAAGHSYPAVWIVQALLGALTCLWVYLLARRLFGAQPARWSLGLSALFVPSILFVPLLMTETLYVCLMMVWALALTEAVSRRFVVWGTVAGLLGGWLMLTKPLAIPLVAAGLLALRRSAARQVLVWAAGVSLVVVIPWVVSQSLAHGRFIPVSAAAENMWVGFHDRATGELVLPETDPDVQALSYAELEDVGYREARRFIQAHPVKAIGLGLRKLSLFFSLIRPGTFWPHLEGLERALATVASLALGALVFMAGGLGLWASRAHPDPAAALLRWMAIVIPLSLIPFYVESHFRQPCFAILLVFAGDGLLRLRGWALDHRGVAPAVWGGWLLANAVLDAALSWPTILGKWRG